MQINVTEILTVLNLFLLIGVTIGGYLALRTTVARAEIDVQTRVREALTAENDLLRDKIKRVEQDLYAYRHQMRILLETLKKRYDLDITIEPDAVVIRDKQSTQIIPISGSGSGSGSGPLTN